MLHNLKLCLFHRLIKLEIVFVRVPYILDFLLLISLGDSTVFLAYFDMVGFVSAVVSGQLKNITLSKLFLKSGVDSDRPSSIL